MKNLFKNYTTAVDTDLVKAKVMEITEKSHELINVETLKKIFSLLDLTTLGVADTQAKGKLFADNVSNFQTHYPQMPNVAAICVYPTLVNVVKQNLKDKNVGIASVVGGFPASQTFLEIKTVETRLAIEAGATEADMVISVGTFLSGNYETVHKEVKELKKATGSHHLKVILETGSLENLTNVRIASLISMNAGGDFIKTSTGKTEPAATLEAVYVMAVAVKDYFTKTKKKIGIKPAGGIADVQTAVKYYAIMKEVLGEEWLNPHLFRIGASSLANNILTEINKLEGKTGDVKYF